MCVCLVGGLIETVLTPAGSDRKPSAEVPNRDGGCAKSTESLSFVSWVQLGGRWGGAEDLKGTLSVGLLRAPAKIPKADAMPIGLSLSRTARFIRSLFVVKGVFSLAATVLQLNRPKACYCAAFPISFHGLPFGKGVHGPGLLRMHLANANKSPSPPNGCAAHLTHQVGGATLLPLRLSAQAPKKSDDVLNVPSACCWLLLAHQRASIAQKKAKG